MTNKVVLYGNGSSGNHGCEAIYRGTREILDCPLLIQTENEMEDRKYGIDQIACLSPSKSTNASFFHKMHAYYSLKVNRSFTEMDGIYYLNAIKKASNESNLAFSVGGDNYCYGYPEIYAYLNRMYKRYGFKTVLWGCSVEPKLTKDSKVAKDLKNYSLIVARESITYDAIKQTGANVVYCPDPAFFMKPEPVVYDERMDKDTIGINCSPMIISNEKETGIVYQNYKKLIEYILCETDKNVALIPHVVWENNDDRKILTRLYEEFADRNRIILVEDHNAPQLKFIISKCKAFVGARTHATIAAYSSGVPTLAVGYSVKAKGIATDLFGSDEHYVLPVQSMKEDTDLIKEWKWIVSHENRIHERLDNISSEYVELRNKTVETIHQMEQ